MSKKEPVTFQVTVGYGVVQDVEIINQNKALLRQPIKIIVFDHDNRKAEENPEEYEPEVYTFKKQKRRLRPGWPQNIMTL